MGYLMQELHIAEIAKIFPVKIDLYGFHPAAGYNLAKIIGSSCTASGRDTSKCSRTTYRKGLRWANLSWETLRTPARRSYADYDPAPIGCVFHDLDFYSSTRDALTVF